MTLKYYIIIPYVHHDAMGYHSLSQRRQFEGERLKKNTIFFYFFYQGSFSGDALKRHMDMLLLAWAMSEHTCVLSV